VPKTTALLFPGQGSGTITSGMGRKFLTKRGAEYDVARDIIFRISAIVNQDLGSLCAFASQEELNQTANSQIASLTMNLAKAELLKQGKQKAIFEDRTTWCAGNSVGEFSAAVEAGALSVVDAATVVMERASLMTQAC